MYRLIGIAGLVVALSAATAHGQVVLDLDTAMGDQGVREQSVTPGQMVEVELLATGGASGMIGFEIEVAFDARQVIFKGFQAGGMMAGALSMPPRSSQESVVVSTAIMGGRTLTEDAGSLGKFLFEAARSLSGSVEIRIVSGSFGSQQGTRKFESDALVRLVSGATPSMGDGQDAPTQQPQPQGFQNPAGSRKPGRGQNPQGRGPQRPRSEHPQGQPHEGPNGGPDPAMLIQELPGELQETFKSTLKTEEESRRAHTQAELTMLRSVRRTLEATKSYLARATDDEKGRIGRVLKFFNDRDRDHPEGNGHDDGMRRMRPGDPGSMNVEQMVRNMIQQVEEEIRHLEQEQQ